MNAVSQIRYLPFKEEVLIKLFMGFLMHVHSNTIMHDKCGHTSF